MSATSSLRRNAPQPAHRQKRAVSQVGEVGAVEDRDELLELVVLYGCLLRRRHAVAPLAA
ncbi:MAG: hypothetical protein ABSC94_29260 [Polyangiaceae bacterium]